MGRRVALHGGLVAEGGGKRQQQGAVGAGSAEAEAAEQPGQGAVEGQAEALGKQA